MSGWEIIGPGHKPGYVKVRCGCKATAMRMEKKLGKRCRKCYLAERRRANDERRAAARRGKKFDRSVQLCGLCCKPGHNSRNCTT